MPVDWISLLPSTTSPELAVSSPSSTLAKVDLPQPDSPTIATVSLSRASKLIDSFALTTRPSPAAPKTSGRRPCSISSGR
jgi:hypothetical protein